MSYGTVQGTSSACAQDRDRVALVAGFEAAPGGSSGTSHQINGSRMDDFTGREADPASSETGLEPACSGLPFQRILIRNALCSRSLAVCE